MRAKARDRCPKKLILQILGSMHQREWRKVKKYSNYR